MVNRFGKVIVLEDDLVTSKWFLRYMNEALDLYDQEEEVISVTAYIYPVRKRLPETFFVKAADCWGWGTWKRGWNLFNENGQYLLQTILGNRLGKEFDFSGAYPYTQMLKDQIARRNDSWAILWYASAFVQNRLTLYPGTSLVKNIGLDGSGANCGKSDKFNVSLAQRSIEIKKIPVSENIEAKANIIRYFRDLTKPPSLVRMALSKLFKAFCSISLIKKIIPC